MRISRILLGVVVGYKAVEFPLAQRAPGFKSFLKFFGVAAEGVVAGHHVRLTPVVIYGVHHAPREGVLIRLFDRGCRGLQPAERIDYAPAPFCGLSRHGIIMCRDHRLENGTKAAGRQGYERLYIIPAMYDGLW